MHGREGYRRVPKAMYCCCGTIVHQLSNKYEERGRDTAAADPTQKKQEKREIDTHHTPIHPHPHT